MKNENRAVFDRAPEAIDYAFEMPTEAKTVSASDKRPEPARKPLGRLFDWFAERLRRRSNAMALLELSDEQLKDIGVSRCQAYGGYSRYRQTDSHRLESRCR